MNSWSECVGSIPVNTEDAIKKSPNPFKSVEAQFPSVARARGCHLGCRHCHLPDSKLRANPSGSSSIVVQGIGSWLACHEFELGTTEDPPCREVMHVKSVESLSILLLCCDLDCKLGYPPRHLTLVQITRPVAKSPRVAEQCDVNIHSLVAEPIRSNM
ncbi:hypothetical protein TNCV_1714581 [Trichonephila clavipes]|nr:hypothetical protein TNCV_1714581 [Trichonephila clavipes]